MPRKWVGQPLAIIETPGPARRFKRRIAGLVIFEPSWCYADPGAFGRDRVKHLVDVDDWRFGWKGNNRPKWAWPVRWVEAYQQPLPADFRAGIRYARAVEILRPSVGLLESLGQGISPARPSLRKGIADDLRRSGPECTTPTECCHLMVFHFEGMLLRHGIDGLSERSISPRATSIQTSSSTSGS